MSGTMPDPPGVLSVNTNLGQPGSGYFRLFDALTLLNQGPALTMLQQQQQQLQQQQAQLTDLQNQLQVYADYLQQQILVIDGRLAAAGIP